MASVPDVLVIGGGVIGLTTAYYAARDGLRVVVAERQQLGRESSWAGAGIISPGNPARARTPLGKLKAASAALFPVLSAELRELTGIDNGYVRCGGLELQLSEDLWERRRIAAVLRQERGEGLEQLQVLDRAALHALEPALADDLPGAIYFPGMAQVRNPWHLRALIAACERLGVSFRTETEIRAWHPEGSRILSVSTDQERLAAGAFVLASGAWSEALLLLLGWQAGIHPVRGQIVLLNSSRRGQDQPVLPGRASDVHLPVAAAEPPRAPLLFSRILQIGSDYLVPRTDGRVLVGSTEERVGFDKSTTEEAVQRLKHLAHRLVPALREAEVERCWAGLRPGNPDGKPVLGPVPGYDNLFVATGHFRSGIHLSAITGRLLADLLAGKRPQFPLDAFGLERFRPAC